MSVPLCTSTTLRHDHLNSRIVMKAVALFLLSFITLTLQAQESAIGIRINDFSIFSLGTDQRTDNADIYRLTESSRHNVDLSIWYRNSSWTALPIIIRADLQNYNDNSTYADIQVDRRNENELKSSFQRYAINAGVVKSIGLEKGFSIEMSGLAGYGVRFNTESERISRRYDDNGMLEVTSVLTTDSPITHTIGASLVPALYLHLYKGIHIGAEYNLGIDYDFQNGTITRTSSVSHTSGSNTPTVDTVAILEDRDVVSFYQSLSVGIQYRF